MLSSAYSQAIRAVAFPFALVNPESLHPPSSPYSHCTTLPSITFPRTRYKYHRAFLHYHALSPPPQRPYSLRKAHWRICKRELCHGTIHTEQVVSAYSPPVSHTEKPGERVVSAVKRLSPVFLRRALFWSVGCSDLICTVGWRVRSPRGSGRH